MNKKSLCRDVVHRVFIISIFFCCLLSASAQDWEWEGVGVRTTAGIRWRALPKLSVSAEYQLRTQPNFKGIERQSISASLSYKITDWLKMGSGYSFLACYSEDGAFRPKNRFFFDITASLKTGNWKLSLAENFKFNNKSYSINDYEQVKNDCSLSTVFKVSYAGFEKVEPYASVDARIALNDPSWSYDYDETSGIYLNPVFNGYKKVYLSRIRPSLGVVWSITKKHGLDFKVLCDFNHKQKIKASTDGTELTSISWKNSILLSFSIKYTFSF